MARVWFISDTHFYHGNIIRYCNRPWFSKRDEKGSPVILPQDTDRMNADMIKNWNQTVGSDDVVWHLGDFAREETSLNMVRDVVTQLSGKINLVMGNHDSMSIKKYLQCGFNRVYDYPVIFDDTFILSHEPIAQTDKLGGYTNIFGHVHNNGQYQTFTPNSVCVCVERHNYAPISYEYIRAELQKQHG